MNIIPVDHVLIVVSVVLLTLCGIHLIGWYIDRRERVRAVATIEAFHGDLPPLEQFYGESLLFLSVIMPYYLVSFERRAEAREALVKNEVPLPNWTKWTVENAVPLDPDEGEERKERKEHLRENVRDYAVAKYGAMPAWKPPCDTCGSNCGQCGSSHCARCGAKAKDGTPCDLVQHEAWKLEHPQEHAENELRKSQERLKATVQATPTGIVFKED